MATNQVINGSNRVIEHPNRFQLNAVTGQANTYDLEAITGEVIDAGTPYSKNILDKVDNLLSYLTPSVEKTISGQIEKEDILSETFIPDVLSTTYTASSYFDEINGYFKKYTTIDDGDIIPSFNISAYYNGEKIRFKSEVNSSTSYSGVHTRNGNTTTRYTSDYLLDALKYTSYSSNYYAAFETKNTSTFIEYLIDFKRPVKIDYSIYIGTQYSVGNMYGSNDGVNYTLINSISPNAQRSLVSNNYYRYYKLKLNQTSGQLSIYLYNFYVTKITYKYNEYLYNNSFTLDNNGNTFINNQRVLIETTQRYTYEEFTDIFDYRGNCVCDTIQTTLSQNGSYDLISGTYSDISSYYEYKPNLSITTSYSGGITISDDYSLNKPIMSFYNGAYNYTGEKLVERLQEISENGAYGIYIYPFNNFINFVWDFKVIVNATFKCNTGSSEKMYGSNDGITYTLIGNTSGNFNDTVQTFNYRYFKLEITGTMNHPISYAYFTNITGSATYTISIDNYDGITSNTLNGIDISTLLQPSSKYELIYNENTNKFELGVPKVLYDITLTQDTNEISLLGITDKLERAKLYKLTVCGGITGAVSAQIRIGNSNSGYLAADGSFSILTFFQINDYIDTDYHNVRITTYYSSASNAFISGQSVLKNDTNNYEHIVLSNTSYKFKSGTRFIISEVA